MIQVTKARYIDQYRIYLVFNNHKEGIVDLKAVIGKDHRPIFTDLADIDKFKKFKVESDTIVWENGLDLAPEYLYEKLESAQ
jgi:hypothetical protein